MRIEFTFEFKSSRIARKAQYIVAELYLKWEHGE